MEENFTELDWALLSAYADEHDEEIGDGTRARWPGRTNSGAVVVLHSDRGIRSWNSYARQAAMVDLAVLLARDPDEYEFTAKGFQYVRDKELDVLFALLSKEDNL